MTDQRPTILLLSADACTREHWRQVLLPLEATLLEDASSIASDQPPTLIVFDCQKALEGATRDGWIGSKQIGLIAVGLPVEADVSLPQDASAGELRLACRLLSEIVQLRNHDQQRKQTIAQLTHQASVDPVTGLANRRAWDERLELPVGSALPAVCLAVIDLDHFKQVNDQHGHAAGDAVLKAVAAALTDNTRQFDFVARLGGDEFGLLLQMDPKLDALPVVDRIRQAVGNLRLADSLGRVTASAGLATSHTLPSAGALELSALADQALRQAKQQGRDRTVQAGTPAQ